MSVTISALQKFIYNVGVANSVNDVITHFQMCIVYVHRGYKYTFWNMGSAILAL